jgi:CheY-like chemotaxis protein
MESRCSVDGTRFAVAAAVARILVVDDQENARRALSIALRLEGFVVAEAADGRDALDRLGTFTPDLCLIDLMMPGMNGLELSRQLRDRAPEIRIVLTSAYHLSERQLERSGLGRVAFVPKPCEMQELVRFLRDKTAA